MIIELSKAEVSESIVTYLKGQGIYGDTMSVTIGRNGGATINIENNTNIDNDVVNRELTESFDKDKEEELKFGLED